MKQRGGSEKNPGSGSSSRSGNVKTHDRPKGLKEAQQNLSQPAQGGLKEASQNTQPVRGVPPTPPAGKGNTTLSSSSTIASPTAHHKHDPPPPFFENNNNSITKITTPGSPNFISDSPSPAGTRV